MCLPPKISPELVRKQKQDIINKKPVAVAVALAVPTHLKTSDFTTNAAFTKPDIFTQCFYLQELKVNQDKMHLELLALKKELSAAQAREKSLMDKLEITMLLLHKQNSQRLSGRITKC